MKVPLQITFRDMEASAAMAVRKAAILASLMLAGAAALGVSCPAFAQRGSIGGAHGGGAPSGGAPRGAPIGGGPHQHLDSRFSHNQYYYDHGYSVSRPPAGGKEFRGPDGGRYWFNGGNWYCWRGGRWVVWPAPIGLYIAFLPPFYTTFWWYGVLYYYANDTYYWWDDTQQEYEVVAAPAGADAGTPAQGPTNERLFVYPKNGQSSAQQAQDQVECHQWAVKQSGFDPTVPGAIGSADSTQRADYLRAQVSCLEGRGYSVD